MSNSSGKNSKKISTIGTGQIEEWIKSPEMHKGPTTKWNNIYREPPIAKCTL